MGSAAMTNDFVEVRQERPPNYDAIIAALPAVKDLHGVIFTYYPHIYVPDGGLLSQALLKHESVHLAQHVAYGGPEKWWARYLDDVDFRYREELVAHRAEIRAARKEFKDRNEYTRYTHAVAQRLASPMYSVKRSPMKVLKELTA